jgi:A/G-specific adenine glycosylase
MEFPSSDWVEEKSAGKHPFKAAWRPLAGEVLHTFTHFHLVLEVHAAEGLSADALDGQWWPLDALDQLALPTVMKKVARHALAAQN